MDFGNFKLNNYIKYNGKITNHSPRIGVITAINSWNNEDNFDVTLRKRYPTDTATQLRAYLGEISPITLRDEFLIKHHFEFNEKTRLYKRDNVIIYNPLFLKYTNDLFGNQKLCSDNKGFRIINATIENFAIETEVLEKSYFVNTVNALQNYYEEILKISFEVNFD